MGVNKTIRKINESPIGDIVTVVGWISAGLLLLRFMTGKKAAPQQQAALGKYANPRVEDTTVGKHADRVRIEDAARRAAFAAKVR